MLDIGGSVGDRSCVGNQSCYGADPAAIVGDDSCNYDTGGTEGACAGLGGKQEELSKSSSLPVWVLKFISPSFYLLLIFQP